MDGDTNSDIRKDVQIDCKSIWPVLSLYADSEVSDFEKIVVEAHIKQCASCTDELTWLKSTSVMIAGTSDVAPPAYLRARILAATVDKPTFAGWLLRRSSATFRYNPARYATVATAAVLLAVAVTFNRHRMEPLAIDSVPPRAAVAIVPAHPATNRVSDKIVSENEGIDEPTSIPAASQNIPARIEMARLAIQPNHQSAPVTAPLVFKKKPETVLPKSSMPGSPVYKAKPAPTVKDAEDPMPNPPEFKEPVNVPVGGGMVTADIKTLVVPTGEAESSVRTPSVSHITLSASASEFPADQTVSLAGLKQALKQQSMGWNAAEARQNLKDKQIRVDLLKRSF